jgi:hypothetical protein
MTEIPIPTNPTEPIPTRALFAQIVAALMVALDQFMDSVTGFGEAEGVTKSLIRKKRRTPPAFVNHAVSAVLTDTDLQSVPQLDAEQVRESRELIDELKRALEHMGNVHKALKTAIEAREALLVTNAEQIYGIARTLVRDRDSSTLAVHVDNMRKARRAAKRRKPDDVLEIKKEGNDQKK